MRDGVEMRLIARCARSVQCVHLQHDDRSHRTIRPSPSARASSPRVASARSIAKAWRLIEIGRRLSRRRRAARRAAASTREASFLYATESMRLTTRLMQLASWLLLQRAVNEGEITAENARTEKEKVKFSATPDRARRPRLCRPAADACAAYRPSDRLFARVQQLDRLERGDIAEAVPPRPKARSAISWRASAPPSASCSA